MYMYKQRIRSDRNLVSRVISPRGTYVQSFRSIDPAVTKRALLTDDGQHIIVRAHTWAKGVKLWPGNWVMSVRGAAWQCTGEVWIQEYNSPTYWIFSYFLSLIPWGPKDGNLNFWHVFSQFIVKCSPLLFFCVQTWPEKVLRFRCNGKARDGQASMYAAINLD
jgi:hypothetical protein